MLWGLLFLGSIASSTTGGLTAAAGETVITGDSYAHSSVTTVVNSNDSGGTSVVDIETNSNGEVKREHVEKTLKPGESSVVSVSVTASSSGSVTIATSSLGTATSSDIVSKVRKGISLFFFGNHGSSTASSTTHSSSTQRVKTTETAIFSSFTNFFGRMWSFFGF